MVVAVDGCLPDPTAPGYHLAVNLERQQVTTPFGEVLAFAVDLFRKRCLLQGLDDISLTLQHVAEIRTFEEQRKLAEPWLFSP